MKEDFVKSLQLHRISHRPVIKCIPVNRICMHLYALDSLADLFNKSFPANKRDS